MIFGGQIRGSLALTYEHSDHSFIKFHLCISLHSSRRCITWSTTSLIAFSVRNLFWNAGTSNIHSFLYRYHSEIRCVCVYGACKCWDIGRKVSTFVCQCRCVGHVLLLAYATASHNSGRRGWAHILRCWSVGRYSTLAPPKFNDFYLEIWLNQC